MFEEPHERELTTDPTIESYVRKTPLGNFIMDSLNEMKALKERIHYLSEWLKYYQVQYYAGTPQITDKEYDRLEDELRFLDPTNSVLQKIGSPVYGQKVEHERPMLSLEKVRTVGEVFSWMEGESCVVTHKLDGSAASLVFKKVEESPIWGSFVLGKTRGDGKVGENITEHLRFIDFPKIGLPDCEIRGEICISEVKFAELTDEMLRRGLERPNSIRNIVAGLLNRKDHTDLCRFLDFIAYDLITEGLEFHSENEKLHTLRERGFKLPDYVWASSLEDIESTLKWYSNEGNKEYLTDGLVFSINSLAVQHKRGATNHHPKGKLAFKFPSEVRQTLLKGIELDVGRTGKLTFVGIVEPIELSGATVSRVTLHNFKYIQENKIAPGCTIEITRSGEVIPKHVRTVASVGEYLAPLECPVCGGPLQWSDTQVDLICTSLECPAKLLGQVSNWISQVGIDGIGDSTLETLYERGWIEGIPDLYKLDAGLIAQIDGFGEKSAKIIVENVGKCKKIPIFQFLPALGVPGLGKGVAKLILSEYSTIEELWELTKADLEKIHGIGEVLAGTIAGALKYQAHKLYLELKNVGVHVLNVEKVKGGAFSGKTVVITGKLSRNRNEIESWIVLRGGKCASSVSKNTSYLVCNEPSTSSKYKNAEKYGIPVISEENLYQMDESLNAETP